SDSTSDSVSDSLNDNSGDFWNDSDSKGSPSSDSITGRTDGSKISDDSTGTENTASGYLPKTGEEDGLGLTSVGLAMLAALAAKKKKKKN
ncbi:TPA: LPXTG cell wall anchor domain-containing protein, partial [Enterococcus faecium]